jgi:hypothetical protein
MIDPAAYLEVIDFGSPEKLADDLRRKEQAAGASWPSSLIPEVTPMLEILKFVSNFFMTCMKPISVKLTVLWGFLHLVLVVSPASILGAHSY